VEETIGQAAKNMPNELLFPKGGVAGNIKRRIKNAIDS